MSRLIDKDFEKLSEFLAHYSLAEVLNSQARKHLIKRGHKCSLAALQIWAVVDRFSNLDELQFHGRKMERGSATFDQLAESFSDLTSAHFAALHGLYKPAHMSLRSAIETFVRAISGVESPAAASTTSVYKLFELAKDCDGFRGYAAPHFAAIHGQYAELCDHVHSAQPGSLVKNYAMSNFPKQDIESLRLWVRHTELTIKAILAILIFANKSLYLKSALLAQDVYEEVITKDARLFAMGGLIV